MPHITEADEAAFDRAFGEALRDVLEAKKDPRLCRCGKPLVGGDERERGHCSTCEVASWSPEKRASIGKLVGLGARRAFGGQPVADSEIDSAIDDMFRHPE